MGLDAFSDDEEEDNEPQESDENEEQEETTTEQEKEDKKEKASGLNAFMSQSESSSTSESEDGDDVPEPLIGKIPSDKWNSMSKVERVKYVREHHIPDYRPDVRTDDRWDWKHVTEVMCVCGNVFTFDGKGLCLGCGRVYQTHGALTRQVVELKYEPEEEEEIHVNSEEPD